MMKKKNEFDCMYLTIEDIANNIGVVYDRAGDYSVIFQIENLVEQYSANIDAYYEATQLYCSIIKTLGEGYSIQKQDIFCREAFSKNPNPKAGFLAKSYLKYFKGREYTDHKTYITITQEVKRSNFQMYNKNKWEDFLNKVNKISDLFESKNINYSILDSQHIEDYLYRFLGVSFKQGSFSLNNFHSGDDYVKSGDKAIKMVDLINIDEVILPTNIKPYTVKNSYPMDLFAFLAFVPGADIIVYSQTIIIPSQRKENGKLEANKNRKENMPDPANLLAAKDISNVIEAIHTDNKMLVYSNFSVMIVTKDIDEIKDKAFNYVEKGFYDCGCGINKNSYNQLELFINNFPANQYSLKKYERFLCLHDTAACFFYKERMKNDEDTPLQVYYTDRQGKPVSIDITGKEGKEKYTTNSNFISIGPSGSGKSFHMNSVVRQLAEQDTDIVLVDTGNSYEGICDYFNGTYIAYSEEKPITINPFKISKEEINIEKIQFLKNLILLIWKGEDAKINKAEDSVIENTINTYFDFYFSPFEHFSKNRKQEIETLLQLEYKTNGNILESKTEERNRERVKEKITKLLELKNRGEGGEKTNAEDAINNLLDDNGLKMEDLYNPEQRMLNKIKEEINRQEEYLASIEVKELSFNAFYEFSIVYIPYVSKLNKIHFDLNDYLWVLKAFYKGGNYETILNEDMGSSLFESKFIVFEIDKIKDNKTLFPIVTLIIMDVFIQKMRLKKNRKALIIEEAWKAIANPLMADYIKYLYKTVRKFWGIVGVVTQELNDILSSQIVKESIINNSEITILLDQAKFKERYDEIKKLLGLTDVDCNNIWSINNLDNKEGRSYFKEVFIRRGKKGEVFGVEECPQSYMAYTTERLEKDALKLYIKKFGSYENGIIEFCNDWEKTTGFYVKAEKYAGMVNNAFKKYTNNYFEKAEELFMSDWENHTGEEPFAVWVNKNRSL